MDAALGHQSKHHRSNGEQIGSAVDGQSFGLLRRHVGQGAEHGAVHGHGYAVADSRDPEVEHLEAAGVGHEQVVELDVAVDDSLGVGSGEHVEQLVQVAKHLIGSHPLGATKHGAQGIAVQQLHHHEGHALLGGVHVHHRHRAGMAQPVGHLGLPLEAQAQLFGDRDLGVQDLDGDLVADAVARGVDCRHSPDAEQLLEGPFASQDGPDAFLELEVVVGGHASRYAIVGQPLKGDDAKANPVYDLAATAGGLWGLHRLRHRIAMAALDWVVLGVYIAAMIGMSLYLSRGQESTEDYYVGGRNLPWWAVGVSTMATQTSANSFIGIPAYVALKEGGGLTWLQYELAVPLAMVFVMIFLIPLFRSLELVSVYEYLELRFDRPTRLVMSAVFLLSRGLATGIGVYASAVVLSVCLSVPIWACILIIGIVTVIYDTLGGMAAVVYSDVVQMVVLLGGLLLCIGLAVSEVGGLSAALAAHAPERLVGIDPRLR